MYTKYFRSCNIQSAIFIVIIAHCNPNHASTTLVSYDFEDAAGSFENEAESSVPALEPSAWFDAQGSLTSFSGNPGKALAARSFLDGNSLTLVMNVLPGFTIHLDNYSFDHQASASGPMHWALNINGSPITGGTISTSFTNVNGALPLGGFRDSITVKLFGSAAPSNSGTYRLDNFHLNGSVTSVPLAPGIVLLGSGLAFMSTRLKR